MEVFQIENNGGTAFFAPQCKFFAFLNSISAFIKLNHIHVALHCKMNQTSLYLRTTSCRPGALVSSTKTMKESKNQIL